MNLTITVTQEDIKHGKPGKLGCCPIALALRRSTGNNNLVVLVKTMETKSGSLVVDLPWDAIQFVDRFDRGKPVNPIEFDLNVPDNLMSNL